MAHKTLIGGTAYSVSGGKTLVNGTAYSVKNGKTLVDGTAYGIDFAKETEIVTVTISTDAGLSSQFIIDGISYWLNKSAAGTTNSSYTFELETGSIITFVADVSECDCGEESGRISVYLTNSSASNKFVYGGTANYEYKVVSNATIKFARIRGSCKECDEKYYYCTCYITEE